MTDRILWNRRPVDPNVVDRDTDIDEIVIHNATVHVEQMTARLWWIGVTKPDGTQWMGNFHCDSRGRMRFTEQDNEGIVWDADDSHEER